MRGHKNLIRALLLYTFIAIFMTLPLGLHLADRIPSDLGDPLYFIWILDWHIHGLKSGFKDFWNGNIFFPHRGTVLYMDYFPFLAVLGLPLFVLSQDLILTYNFLFLLSFILAALGMYLLMRELTWSTSAAFIAGLVFAFCPYRMAHISHLELLNYAWIPLCFLFFIRFFENPSWRNLTSAGLFFILQALSCAYYGVYLTLFAGLLVLYFSWKKGFFKRKDYWLKMGVLIAGGFILLFPFFYPYIQVHKRMMLSRDIAEVEHYSAQVQHFFCAPPSNTLWGKLLKGPPNPEWQRYPGMVALTLGILWLILRRPSRQKELRQEKTRLFFWWDILTGCYLLVLFHVAMSGGFTIRWGEMKILSIHRLTNPLLILSISLLLRICLGFRSRAPRQIDIPGVNLAKRFFLFSFFSAWLLALGPVIRVFDKPILTGPFLLLYRWIPVFKALRAPSRMAVFMMLALALFCGWAMEILLEKQKKRGWKKALPVLISLLLLADYASIPLSLAKLPGTKKFPAIYSPVRNLPTDAVLIELPMPIEPLERGHEALPMFYSTFHRKKLVNGYSGYVPPGYVVISESMEEFPSPETFRLLEDLGVSYILVHTRGFRPEKGLLTNALLQKFLDHVELKASAEGDYLYRIIPKGQNEEVERKSLIEVGDRKLWTGWTSSNVECIKLAFDGRPTTGWTSRFPQRPGDFFFLDLGETLSAELLEISFSSKPLDYPRGFTVEGSTDQRSWVFLNETPFSIPRLTQTNIEDLSGYRMRVVLKTKEVRSLRIRLTRPHPRQHWSIQEIRLFGPSR